MQCTHIFFKDKLFFKISYKVGQDQHRLKSIPKTFNIDTIFLHNKLYYENPLSEMKDRQI